MCGRGALWEPIYQDVPGEDPGFEKNRDFPRDMFNIAVGLVWQTSLVTCDRSTW